MWLGDSCSNHPISHDKTLCAGHTDLDTSTTLTSVKSQQNIDSNWVGFWRIY